MALTKRKDDYLVLGIPQVPPGENFHPGGQLTAANGLVQFLTSNGINFEILNTVATYYPPVPIWKKSLQSAGRIGKAWFTLIKGNVSGYLAFSGFGLSLYERCCIALIYRIHNKPSVIFFRSSEIIGQPVSRFKRKILSWIIKIPSVIVSQGSLLASELHCIGRNSVEIIPNWLPTDYSIAQHPKSYPKDGIVDFIFVGWLERSKGILELIEAAVILQTMTNRYRLHLVGNGSLESEVANLIAEQELRNVFAIGWLNQSEVKNLLNCSHVFVLPSHTEGFPNAVLEAMAHGLPIISTSVGGIPDSIIHDVNGTLISVGDVRSLAASMRRYIENTELIPSHSQQAIEKVKQLHSLDVNCKKLIHLLS